MERTWLILGRVMRVVVQAEAQAQAQVQHAAVGEAEEAAQAQGVHAAVGEAEEAAAQAEQAEVGEAEDAAARAELEDRVVSVDVPVNFGAPGFTLSVAPPPRVTFLTAHGNSQPAGEERDMYPYIIATGPFCLLAHFGTRPRYSGTDFRRLLTGRRERNDHHLVVVRYFRRADGQIAGTAVCAPVRPWISVTDLRNIESISLVCDGYNYRIAELMVNTSRRNPSLELVIFRSDHSHWFKMQLTSPLVEWDGHRRWVPHGAVAVGSTAMWFDLSWGILSCDVFEEQPEVSFYRLPRDRALRKGGDTEDIHRRRCIAVSGDLLRYVEIIIPGPNGEAAAVSMWSLQLGDEGWRWIANYRVSFQEIWNDGSYAATALAHDIPVLAGVCPANPNVVYFDLHQRLFGVNVPERRVVDYEAIQHQLVNVPGLPQAQTASSRFLVTWNLLRPGRGEIIGHVSPDLRQDDYPDKKDEEPQDQDPKGKSKATDVRRKSTSASGGPISKTLRIK